MLRKLAGHTSIRRVVQYGRITICRLRAAEVGRGCRRTVVADEHEGLFDPPAWRGIEKPPVDVDRGLQPVISPTQLHRDRAAQGVSHDANTIEVEPATESAVWVDTVQQLQ